MILSLAAALVSAPPQAPAPGAPAESIVCGRTMSYEDAVCAALVAGKQWNYADAAQAYERAAQYSVESQPSAARALAAAGNMWIAAGEPGKAAVVLDRALASPGLQAEQRGEALLDRARAAEAQNDLKTARARLGEAMAIIGEDPFVWYFSAALAIREGDKATAQTAVNKALALAPSDPSILFEAGHVAHFTGQEAQARRYWQQAAALDPAGPIGKSARDAIALLPAPVTVKDEGANRR